MKLSVPYFAQNDNSPDLTDGAGGNTQCNATSHTMLVAYLLPDFVSRSNANGYHEPEDYFKSKLIKYTSDRGDHKGFTECLAKEFKVISDWRYDLTKADIIKSIDLKIPCVLGFSYKTSGHIVCCTGYTNDGLYINDPYGIREGSEDVYDDINPGYGCQDGKDDFYTWDTLNKVLFIPTAWGRIVKKISS